MLTTGFGECLEKSLEKVTSWYKSKMDYDLPRVNLVPVQYDQVKNWDGFREEGVVFVNTGIYYDRNLRAEAILKTLDRRHRERFGKRMAQLERDRIFSKLKSDVKISTFPGQESYPYNTIFVLPYAREAIGGSVVPIPFMEAVLVHDLFHIIQYEKGFEWKYPFAGEHTADFVERSYVNESYGNDNLMVIAFDLIYGEFPDKRKKGIQIVSNALQDFLNMRPNLKIYMDFSKLLDDVKLLLHEPCYEKINYKIFKALKEAFYERMIKKPSSRTT